MTQNLQKFLFNVDDYYKLAAVGIIGSEDKVELIKGEIVNMSPSNSMHAHVINVLNRKFSKVTGDLFFISVQNPLRIGNYSEPEPDVLLVKPKSYKDQHPVPNDVLILVEVSASTLRFDQTIKKELYAEAGIPEYWIVNLIDQKVEVYTSPEKNTYLNESSFGLQDVVSAKQTDIQLNVGDLFE